MQPNSIYEDNSICPYKYITCIYYQNMNLQARTSILIKWNFEEKFIL